MNQRTRFLLLVVDVAILMLASRLGFASYWPTNDDKGFWFFTALLGLLLGSRLDTPFFVSPSDVFLYAAPALIALLLLNGNASWPTDTRAAFFAAICYCAFCILAASLAILANGSRSIKWQKLSEVLRVVSSTFGTPRIVFSVLICFALFAFHRDAPLEFAAVSSAWILTAVLSPVEGILKLATRIRRALGSGTIDGQDGILLAHQTPGLLLIRQGDKRSIPLGSLVVARDSVGSATIARALDHVGRDDGILIRAIEVDDPELLKAVTADVRDLPTNSVACVASNAKTVKLLAKWKERGEQMVGIVAPDTSLQKLFFEHIGIVGIEEGRVVEVLVRGERVLYQIVNGLTKEEIVRQRNTRGFARAQAQKLGAWSDSGRRFYMAKWMPQPNAPVVLTAVAELEANREAIGHLPGTQYSVTLKDVTSLVTHNTAILGILGVGKSSLAFELVERIVDAGIKVICIDITGEYEDQLAPHLDREKQKKVEEVLLQSTTGGKQNYASNVEEGGSRAKFAAKLTEIVVRFVAEANTTRLMVINPAKYVVWRQDSKMYNGAASMASVSAAEITRMVSEAALHAVSALGISAKARLALVYEEAHTLVPEWNSASSDGDRLASNGTARAVLQGRKYGMGCIVITQRTANVSKTVLNQCNTVFAMRTFDDTGKAFLANYIGSDYADALPSLTERHAVFFGRASSCENPVMIRLNDRSTFLTCFRPVPPSVSEQSGDIGVDDVANAL